MPQFAVGQQVIAHGQKATVVVPEHPADASLVGVQWGRSGVTYFPHDSVVAILRTEE